MNDNPLSIINVLKSNFGENFEGVTLVQRLVLIEAISILLRGAAGNFGDAIDIAVADDEGVDLPDEILLYSETFATRTEGLQLMGALYSVLVEDYKVLVERRGFDN